MINAYTRSVSEFLSLTQKLSSSHKSSLTPVNLLSNIQKSCTICVRRSLSLSLSCGRSFLMVWQAQGAVVAAGLAAAAMPEPALAARVEEEDEAFGSNISCIQACAVMIVAHACAYLYLLHSLQYPFLFLVLALEGVLSMLSV